MERIEFLSLFQNYTGISALLKSCTYQEIVSVVSEITSISPEVLGTLPMGGYSKGKTSGTYHFVLKDLLQNVGHYDWLYERLADERSREVFTLLMQFRLVPDMKFIASACDGENPQYFDKSFADCDEDIHEKITFIKTDIEGFEVSSLLGAKNHIRDDSPKLAVCTYHIVSDMWEIPRLIESMNPNYRFYLRHYMKTQNWETVLYAIPIKHKKETTVKSDIMHSRKNIVAMAPYERGWSNVELIKDCGLIPYLLHKNYGYHVTMVGANGGPYPYHEMYTKGVEMDFLPNGQVPEKVRYMEKHAREIDGLLLRGCYPTNFQVAEVYKKLNPNGRIYVGLDANSWWMDRILWDEEEFIRFMECCDVIATSCHAMQKHLNEKWPWKIEYIPNGFYVFSEQQKAPVFHEKENIILTVGRIGTEQKATEVLLKAYAKIARRIPDWQVRLVGNIENNFRKYIEEYFTHFPELSGRVRFIGEISDREKLFAEYQRAKIFALPSTLEGGTPNVIAEALHAGCVTAVTRIDAYEDATDYGRCGKSAKIGDVDGFAEILYQLCKEDDLEFLSARAYEYGRSSLDMEKVTARVNELLFGGMYETNNI